MKRLYIALAGCAAFFVFCNASGCKSSDKTTAEKTVEAPAPAQPQPVAEPAPAPAPTDPSKAQRVRISTKFGNMTVMLYNETPQHRDNFLKLVKEKYYDDLLFHRCIKGFMMIGLTQNIQAYQAGRVEHASKTKEVEAMQEVHKESKAAQLAQIMSEVQSYLKEKTPESSFEVDYQKFQDCYQALGSFKTAMMLQDCYQ